MMDSPQAQDNLLAISYALPPSLYPQSIQIGRLLHHLPMEILAVSGVADQSAQTMDTLPDFEAKLHRHRKVPFHAPLPGKLHQLARKFVGLYGRAPDEFRPWISGAVDAALELAKESRTKRLKLVTFGEPMSGHIAGWRLKNRLHLPWIAHFSDPWVDNPFRRHFHLANLINRISERNVIARADRVIFTSPETLDLVMRKYPVKWKEKATVLPHSFDPAGYPGVAAHDPNTIIFRYMGTFYADRRPDPLFRALHRILNNNPALLQGVRFEFIGGVPARMLRNPELQSLPSGLVKFLPSVSYKESLSLMRNADHLMVIDAPGKISVFLPSKLIDYVGAETPILGIVPPGSSARVIRALGGEVANPEDLEGMVGAVERSIALSLSRRAGKEILLPWGEQSERAKYHITRVAKQFAEIVMSTQ